MSAELDAHERLITLKVLTPDSFFLPERAKNGWYSATLRAELKRLDEMEQAANAAPSTSHTDTPDRTTNSREIHDAGALLQLSDELAQGRQRFGFDLLPPPLAAALELVQQSLPTDPLTAVLALLCGYSGLLKIGTRVASSHDFSVPTSLWIAAVMGSGGAKSPLKRRLVDAPATEIRLAAKEAHGRAVREWQEACSGMPKADRPPEPKPLFPHVANYTPEALDRQLELHEGKGLGLLIIRDELSGLLTAIANETRTGRGTAEAQLLETFDGDGSTSIRVEAGARCYERCHVALYGNIQPGKLRALINGDDATGKFARFLFVRVPAQPLQLRVEDPSEEERAAYAKAVQLLQDIAGAYFTLAPTTYELDSSARKLFVPWFRQHQLRALSPATAGVVASMLGKSSAHALRLAGVLKIAWRIHDRNHDTVIGADLMQTAMDIVDQLLAETEAFHDSPETTAGLLMRHVHDLSEQRGRQPVSWSTARAKGTRKIRELRTGDFNEAVVELARLGYGEVDGRGRYTAIRPMAA